MANILFGTPLWSDAEHGATWSGVSWQAALPVTNVALRKLQRLARSVDATLASTVATVDLGSARDVRLLAALLPNLSASGTVRARGFTTVPILDALDFSTGWTAGTASRTPAAYDGAGSDGVPLDLIEDDNAAATEGYTRNVAFTGDGVKCLSFRIKEGTAATTIFRINDTTAGGAQRLRAQVGWSGGAPVVTMGFGTHIATESKGDGVYRITVATTSGLIAANTNELGVFAANTIAGSLAAVGTVYFGDILVWNAATDQLVYDTGRELGIPSAVDTEEREAVNCWWVHPTATAKTARYWRFNLADTANADGYLDVARLIAAGGYQPEVNVSYGCSIGFESRASSEETEGGAAVYDARRVRRTMSGLLEQQSEDEAFGEWFRIKMRHGLTKQIVAVLDPDDTTHLHRRAFAGVFRELTAIEAPYFARYSSAFKIIEDL